MELDNSLELKSNTIYYTGIFFNGYNAKSFHSSVIELCYLQPYCPVAVIESSAPVMKLTVCLELPKCVVHPN